MIGFTPEALPLLEAARVAPHADAGTVALQEDDFGPFIKAAKQHRIWDRELKVRKLAGHWLRQANPVPLVS